MTEPAIALYKALHRKRAYTKLYWDVANVIGINEALLIEVVERWCETNEDKERTRYFHAGEWWTSATYKQWEEMYPALGSDRKIQRTFLKLAHDKYILSCQPLLKKGDPTKYYRVNAAAIGQLLLDGKSMGGLVPNLDEGLVPNLDEVSAKSGRTFVPNLDVLPYIDQIHISDSSNRFTSPLTPQGNCEADAVDSEVLEPEPEISTPSLEEATQLTKIENRNEVPGLDKYSERCDNKTPEPTLLERYQNGEINQLPRPELIKFAKQQLGGLVGVYRKSGVILAPSPNDIDRGFLAFIAKRDRKDSEYASRLVLACERKPERWTELTQMVQSWKAVETFGYSVEHLTRAQEIYESIKDL